MNRWKACVSVETTKSVDFNGIDMVCAFSGVAHSSDYNQQIPIVFGHQNMSNYVANVLYAENNKINVYTGVDFALDWCYITIQYIKTTDWGEEYNMGSIKITKTTIKRSTKGRRSVSRGRKRKK